MGGEISPKFTLWIVNYSGGGQITGLASMQMSLSKQAPRRKRRPSAKQTRHANAAEKSCNEHELKPDGALKNTAVLVPVLVPACLALLLHSLLLLFSFLLNQSFSLSGALSPPPSGAITPCKTLCSRLSARLIDNRPKWLLLVGKSTS